jgi:hypothetical protein
MQWNEKNRYNDARSITEERQELQSCYDALQSQLEQAIEIIYFLEEELEMEKSKKNNTLNNTNKLDTNDDMLRRIPLMPSSNESTQRIDSVATQVRWNSLTGLPLLTEVIDTLKEVLLTNSNIQDGCINDSQQASVHAALNRLREYQVTTSTSVATSNEEVDVVNDEGTINTTSCQGSCNVFEEDGSVHLPYDDSDETKKQLTNALLPGVVKNQLCDSCTEKGVTKMMIVLVTVAKPQNRIIDFHTGVIITNIQILHSSRGNDIWNGNCAIFCERASARTK